MRVVIVLLIAGLSSILGGLSCSGPSTPSRDLNSDGGGADGANHEGAMSERKTVTAVDVTFEWEIQGGYLRGRMSAPTTGWVTVGFNDKSQLDGTKLVMGYVADGKAFCEEHIADPPNHRPKTERGGHNALTAVSGTELNGVTTIDFSLELDSRDPVDIVLIPGRRYYVTLAWSHEDDLYHHSARRTAVEISL